MVCVLVHYLLTSMKNDTKIDHNSVLLLLFGGVSSCCSCVNWWSCESMVEIRKQQLSEWANFPAGLFNRRHGLVQSVSAESAYETWMPIMCNERSKWNRFHQVSVDIAADIPSEKCTPNPFIWWSLVCNEIIMSIFSVNFQILNVITVLDYSGRVDHILSQINTLHKAANFLNDTNLFLLTRNSLAWLLHPGQHTIQIPDRFVAEQYWCSYVPVGDRCCVTTNGLKWDLGKITWCVNALNWLIYRSFDCRKHNLWIWWNRQFVEHIFHHKCSNQMR